METKYVFSADNVKLAYDVQGNGPAVLLLHGLASNRLTWHDSGWVTRLIPEFTVITLDLRGCGESGQPEDVASYEIEKLRDDLQTIADACGVEQFLLLGHSWGATISLQMASQSERVRGAVVAGSFFGRI